MVYIKQRLTLAKDILQALSEMNDKLACLQNQLVEVSKDIFIKVYNDRLVELSQNKTILETNNHDIHLLNTEAIKSINHWREWCNTPSNCNKVLFPFKYFFKINRFKKVVSNINQEVIQKSIENRLIHEKISSWEIEIKRLAENTLKESNPYKNFYELINQKKLLLEDLTYLLSTIPTLHPIEIDFTNNHGLDELLLKLKTLSNTKE